MYEKHGYSGKDRIYRIWYAMRQRCEKEYSANYKNYGALGVTVCDKWKKSFLAFKKWADVSGYAETLSIDRIDSFGNYEPKNCRWVTSLVQSQNKRRDSRVEINGVKKTISTWAIEGNFHFTTLYRRYYKGVRGADLLKGIKPKGSKLRGETKKVFEPKQALKDLCS